MGKIRGFVLKHRVNTIFRCLFRRHRSTAGYHRLGSPSSWREKPISRLFSWTHNLRSKAKSIYRKKLVTGHCYMQIGEDPIEVKKQQSIAVPKGHVAVYVGQKGGDFQRVLVPVIYCNHPLFGQLLREAEDEFGFNHPGAITIPCRISEFEHVQTRIKQGHQNPRKLLCWKR